MDETSISDSQVAPAPVVVKPPVKGLDEYKDYPEEEAQRGNAQIDPGNPDHQAARLAEGVDYIENPSDVRGYIAPDYS